MKQILGVLGLAVLLSGIFTSCKENSLEAMRDREVERLDKYVKDNNLTQYRQPSGIYFWDEQVGDGDPIEGGYMVRVSYDISLIDSTLIFSTQNEHGQTFEEDVFYVDIHNDAVDANYVQKIAGMHIGLKKMRIGGKASMIIPSELAFRAVDYSSTLGIPRFSTLLVTIYVKSGQAYEVKE